MKPITVWTDGDFSQEWVECDGGRAEAGFTSLPTDHVTRAIVIANDWDYGKTYNLMLRRCKVMKTDNRRMLSAGGYMDRRTYEPVLLGTGWKWVGVGAFGNQRKLHLRGDDLPSGVVIAKTRKGLWVFKDGVLYSTRDETNKGKPVVLGYYIKKDN